MKLKPITTLKDFNCPTHIIEHSKAVSNKAKDMASNFMDKTGSNIDWNKLKQVLCYMISAGQKPTQLNMPLKGLAILKSLNFPDKLFKSQLNILVLESLETKQKYSDSRRGIICLALFREDCFPCRQPN